MFLNQQDSCCCHVRSRASSAIALEGAFDVETALGRRGLVARRLLDDSGVAGAGNLLVMDLTRRSRRWARTARLAARRGRGGPRGHRATARGARRGPAVASRRSRTAGPKSELAHCRSGVPQAMLDAIAAMGLVLAVLITANRLATLYRNPAVGDGRTAASAAGALVRALAGESVLVSAVGVLAGLPLGVGFAQLQPVTMSLSLQQVGWSGEPRGKPRVSLLVAGAADFSRCRRGAGFRRFLPRVPAW